MDGEPPEPDPAPSLELPRDEDRPRGQLRDPDLLVRRPQLGDLQLQAVERAGRETSQNLIQGDGEIGGDKGIRKDRILPDYFLYLPISSHLHVPLLTLLPH